MSDLSDKYNYSVVPQHVWDTFMERTGYHKTVPLNVVHRMMTGDFYEEVKNDLPENLKDKFPVERIKLFRAYAMEHGKIGEFDSTFFEPSKSEMYYALKAMMLLHEEDYKNLSMGIGTDTELGSTLLKAKEIVEGYEKFR